MIGTCRFRLLMLAALAWIALVGARRLHAQDERLPESVRTGLVGYGDLDPLAVSWSGSTEATRLGREKIPAKMLASLISARNNAYQLAFRQGRLYQRTQRKFDGSEKPYTSEMAFDGTVLYGGYPGRAEQGPQDSPSLVKWLPTRDDHEGSYWIDEYLRAAGVRMAMRNRELLLPRRPQAELLALLTEGGHVVAVTSTELDGGAVIRVQVTAPDLRTAVPVSDPSAMADLERQLRRNPNLNETEIQRQLRTARKRQGRTALKRRYDFFFDPKIAYAVRRVEIRDDDGQLLSRSDCSEHEQLGGRPLWLPRLCRVQEYTYESLYDEETAVPYVFPSPLYINEFKVTDFDVTPWPDDRFMLRYSRPGTRINDATVPGTTGQHGISYRIPADPKQLEDVIAAAQAQYGAQLQATRWAPSIKTLFLVLNGAVVISVAAYIFARRRRGRHA